MHSSALRHLSITYTSVKSVLFMLRDERQSKNASSKEAACIGGFFILDVAHEILLMSLMHNHLSDNL